MQLNLEAKTKEFQWPGSWKPLFLPSKMRSFPRAAKGLLTSLRCSLYMQKKPPPYCTGNPRNYENMYMFVFYSLIHSLIYLLIYFFVHLFIHLFAHLLIYLLFVYLYILLVS